MATATATTLCTMRGDGYCATHQTFHVGRARTLATEDSQAGERFRVAQDGLFERRMKIARGEMVTAAAAGVATATVVAAGEPERKPTAGVGSTLKMLLARKGIHATPDCGCNGVMIEMDHVGIEGVRKNKQKYVDHLRETGKKYKWDATLNAAWETAKELGVWGTIKLVASIAVGVTDKYEWLVDEAIRVTEEVGIVKPLAASAPPPPPKYTGLLRWSYGVTTTPIRLGNLLPRTLKSLAAAGFDSPRLFIDGFDAPRSYTERFRLEATAWFPGVGAWPAWYLTLAELYFREPNADRYAIFQDDIVVVKGLRSYLDRIEWPDRGYLNLYTQLENDGWDLDGETKQWYANPAFKHAASGTWRQGVLVDNGPERFQAGRGALALVFDVEAVTAILSRRVNFDRVVDPTCGRASIDGAVVTAANLQGYREYVHSPSLVQHTGTMSTIRGPAGANFPLSTTFPGEDFDAMAAGWVPVDVVAAVATEATETPTAAEPAHVGA